jgi:hypothetical protein
LTGIIGLSKHTHLADKLLYLDEPFRLGVESLLQCLMEPETIELRLQGRDQGGDFRRLGVHCLSGVLLRFEGVQRVRRLFR